MSKIAYPIRAVSRLTGISIDTLRAWERRYKAVKPGRDEGERVYDEADVERLILLRKAVERGHAISKLAGLSNKDLEQINERSVALIGLPSSSRDGASHAASPDLTAVYDAIERFDYGEIDTELNRLAALVPPRDLVHDAVVPLMREVGDQWYRGDLSIAQEHMVSAALRGLLGTLVRLYTRHQPASIFLFATPKGERHEFGVLCAAMLAAAGGLGVVYLGADLPYTEIVACAKRTRARVVVVGIKGAVSGKDSLKELHRISETLPPSIELWVGGIRSPEAVREAAKTRAAYLPDLAILERELIRLGAHF